MVKITAVPVLVFSTSAMTTKTMLKTVENTAASWGLLPKGAATKNDQLAKRSPRRTCTAKIKPTLVAENILIRQMTLTMTQAGRYTREMLRCQELTRCCQSSRGIQTRN